MRIAKDAAYCDEEWSQIISGEIATSYNNRVTHWTPIYHWILRRCEPRCHIMDVGCGLGHFLRMAAKLGHKTTGVDFSAVAISDAMRRSPKTKYIQADIEQDASFLNIEYDAVCFVEVLEHLFNDKKLIRQIPPGRDVFISVPLGPIPEGNLSHVRGYLSIDEAVKRYGKIITVTDYELVSQFNFICIKGKSK